MRKLGLCVSLAAVGHFQRPIMGETSNPQVLRTRGYPKVGHFQRPDIPLILPLFPVSFSILAMTSQSSSGKGFWFFSCVFPFRHGARPVSTEIHTFEHVAIPFCKGTVETRRAACRKQISPNKEKKY